MLSGRVLVWLSVWSDVQMTCVWFSLCHCHRCFCKTQNGLSFCYRLTEVVMEKGCAVKQLLLLLLQSSRSSGTDRSAFWDVDAGGPKEGTIYYLLA